MTPRRIRDLFVEVGIPKDAQKDILRETADDARKAGKKKPEPMWMVVIAVLFVTAFPLRWVLSITPTLRPAVRIALGVAVLGVVVAGAIWIMKRKWWTYLTPQLYHRLESRGHRLCAHCGYVLQGTPAETEYCPECGTYISRRSLEDRANNAGPRLISPSMATHGRALVTGVSMTASQVEEIMLAIRHTKQESSRSLERRSTVIAWLIVLVLVGLGVLLNQYMPAFRHFVLLTLVGTVVATVLILILVASALQARRLPQDFRRALRRAGTEVCVSCGQFLGSLESSASSCPQCGAPRESLEKPTS